MSRSTSRIPKGRTNLPWPSSLTPATKPTSCLFRKTRASVSQGTPVSTGTKSGARGLTWYIYKCIYIHTCQADDLGKCMHICVYVHLSVGAACDTMNWLTLNRAPMRASGRSAYAHRHGHMHIYTFTYTHKYICTHICMYRE